MRIVENVVRTAPNHKTKIHLHPARKEEKGERTTERDIKREKAHLNGFFESEAVPSFIKYQKNGGFHARVCMCFTAISNIRYLHSTAV